MSGELSYYEIASSTRNPCTMDPPVYRHAWTTWLCKGCARPLPNARSLDLTIQEEKPDSTPLNGVSGCGVGIALKDFLFDFGAANVRRHLFLGRLFGPDHRLLKGWVTF